jgi:1,6-anhydro-N-acetylmuramate kinase
VARAISQSVRRFLPKRLMPKRIILTGGSVRNGLLWRLLEEQFADLQLERSDSFGIPAESKEAVDAGMLACLLLDGMPANLPAVTGATGSRLLGTLTPGSQSNWSRCLAWMTGDQREFMEDD